MRGWSTADRLRTCIPSQNGARVGGLRLDALGSRGSAGPPRSDFSLTPTRGVTPIVTILMHRLISEPRRTVAMDRDDGPDPAGPRTLKEALMNRRLLRIVVPAALAMAVAFSGTAEASSNSSSRGRRSGSDDRVKFVAALQGTSVARGWGRVEVSDHSHRFDLRRARGKRELEVILIGLQPTALYRVEIDGVTIGGVWTGVTGEGSLRAARARARRAGRPRRRCRCRPARCRRRSGRRIRLRRPPRGAPRSCPTALPSRRAPG